MTIGALLRFSFSDRVWEMRSKGLAGKSDRTDRWLLYIDPLAVDVC